jgi:hypothetical protein
MYNGNRLDWCMTWSEDCGRPAANAYCKAQGFARVLWFEPDKHIGARSPTRLIGTGATCDLAHCDGFRQITCLKQPIATAQRQQPFRSSLGFSPAEKFSRAKFTTRDKFAGTRVASAGPMIVVPPIPTPRPVLVSAKSQHATLTELKPDGAAVEEKEPQAKIEPADDPDEAAGNDQVTASATVDEPKPPAAPSKIFDKPMYNGKRLAWCHEFDADCGRPAADAFCKANGFAAASEFTLDPHIGDVAPTRSIGSGAVCDQAPCDGFKLIACTL